MFYSIRHVTKFSYSGPVTESLMEIRMHPRTDSSQQCLTYQLSLSPRARLHYYRDHLGNAVHHFSVPGQHRNLYIVSEAVVQREPAPELPFQLSPSEWQDLDAVVNDGDFWEFLLPSHFAKPTELLSALTGEHAIVRRDDPLTVLRELNSALYSWFDYVPRSTRVDSPITDALSARRGVCQDFSHVMITLVRGLQIPCRYVSGYLFHSSGTHDRSGDGATHAWVEAYLPTLGWVGFDPTNNLIAGDRHIRTAIGRDYADVPPTRGVFKGKASTDLAVSVKVSPSATLPPMEDELVSTEDWSVYLEPEPEMQQHQQQQQ